MGIDPDAVAQALQTHEQTGACVSDTRELYKSDRLFAI